MIPFEGLWYKTGSKICLFGPLWFVDLRGPQAMGRRGVGELWNSPVGTSGGELCQYVEWLRQVRMVRMWAFLHW
jgi:hypothetical protein